MLHDADYEAWPAEHPRRIVAWLEERGELAVAHAVRPLHALGRVVRHGARQERCSLATS
jgi:hypothetical protein